MLEWHPSNLDITIWPKSICEANTFQTFLAANLSTKIGNFKAHTNIEIRKCGKYI